MVFVELCPYASAGFPLTTDQVTDLAARDPGFKTAARVVDILLDQAQPALVLINGTASVSTFRTLYESRLASWDERLYRSGDSGAKDHMLRHWQGTFRAQHGRLPIIGFPFLRTPRSHNSKVEIRELGADVRVFIQSVQ